MVNDYSRSKLEDKALKSAHMYFGQELLPYFSIGKKIVSMLPTEQIRLEVVRREEDMLFEMEDDSLAHFEFESVEVNEDDLRRFHVYDAYTEMHYKKPVVTYVICSGKVNKIHSKLKYGINTYRIVPLVLKEENADVLFCNLESKKLAGEELTKEDVVPLMLSPLMAGKVSIKDRILKAIKIIGNERLCITKQDKRHMEAVLYAFACKFLNKAELNEVKEVLSMTALGEMIWNDGWSDGEKSGIAKGEEKIVHLMQMLIKAGRDEEINSVLTDREYRKRLLEEELGEEIDD